MTQYSFTQIIFFFLVYCFFGWIIESTYVSVKTKKLTNRGFLRGPVIPIYGCGAMMMVFCAAPFTKWPVAVFFAGLLGCSVLEYCTGMIMEAIFKVRYWDYSNTKGNINGYVCWWASLSWGFLTLGMNYFVHKHVAALSNLLSPLALRIITSLGAGLFIIDLTLSVKAALDLRNLIVKLEKAKEEMRLMSRRLDVMMAYAGESMEERKAKTGERFENWTEGLEEKVEKISDSFEDMTQGIEDRFGSLKKAIEERPQSFAESMKAEFYELRGRFESNGEKRSIQNFVRDFYRREMIKGNPTLESPKFKDSLETIKASVFNRKDKE